MIYWAEWEFVCEGECVCEFVCVYECGWQLIFHSYQSLIPYSFLPIIEPILASLLDFYPITIFYKRVEKKEKLSHWFPICLLGCSHQNLGYKICMKKLSRQNRKVKTSPANVMMEAYPVFFNEISTHFWVFPRIP